MLASRPPDVITLGCRLNLAESETIRALIGARDMVVVNTCGVTNEAVKQSRAAIRRARRDRTRTVLAVAASVLVVAMVATGTWAVWPDGHAPGPASPHTSAPTTDPSTPRPTPGPDQTLDPAQPHPSGLVFRGPDGDLALPADTSCWAPGTECRRALMATDDPGTDLGTGDSLILWFARKVTSKLW